MITDDRPAVILPPGMEQIPKAVLSPPQKTGYFGWLDHAGDINSFKYDEILGVQRSALDRRYYVYVKNLAQPIPIPEKDIIKLLKRMGWSEESAIARVS